MVGGGVSALATGSPVRSAASPTSGVPTPIKQRRIDRMTQLWARATGRRIDESAHPWLDGPNADGRGVGERFFERWAAEHDRVVREPDDAGLIADLEQLRSPAFDPDRVHPNVRDFYERSARYALDAWSEWNPLLKPAAAAVRALFGARLQQLNVPLRPLETADGMTSRVALVSRLDSDGPEFAAWTRTFESSGMTIYAGAYSTCMPPNAGGPCVRVVFPLPNGRAVVILEPHNEPGGAVALRSRGAAFGDPGFYFVTYNGRGKSFARYVPEMTESIVVTRRDDGRVFGDHDIRFYRRSLATIRYRLTPRQADSQQPSRDR